MAQNLTKYIMNYQNFDTQQARFNNFSIGSLQERGKLNGDYLKNTFVKKRPFN